MRSFIAASLLILLSYPSSTATAYAQQTVAQTSKVEADFRAWVKSLERDGTEVSNKGIEFDAINNKVSIKNLILTIRSAQSDVAATKISVDRLTASAFKNDAGGYRFDAAEIEGIKIGTASQLDAVIDLRLLVIGKSYIPDITSFKLDPQRPVTSQVNFLKLLSRADITDATATGLVFNKDLHIESLELIDVAEGNVATLSASMVNRGSQPDPATGAGASADAKISLSKLSLKNVNAETYIRLFDENAYLSAGTARPWSNLIESIALSDLDVKEGNVSLFLKSASVGPLKARQFPNNITSVFDKSSLDTSYLQNNTSEAQILANYIREAFLLEDAQISDLKALYSRNDGQMEATVRAAEIGNLSATHIDHFTIDAAKISDASGSIAVNRAKIEDVNIPLRPTSTTDEVHAAQSMNEVIPTVGNIVAEGLEAKLAGVFAALEKLSIRMSYFIDSTPTNIKAKIDHLAFPVAQIPELGPRQVLSDLGYEKIDLSAELSGSWQDAASAIAFDLFQISGAEMGSLKLSGSLTGITRKSIEAPASSLMAEIAAGGLQNFRLSFENHSLVDRLIAQAAKANNKSPEELKRLLSANMPALMSQISSPAIRSKFIFAAVSFVNNPKIFELISGTTAVTPIRQITEALSAPYKLPSVLDLDASANERK